MTRDDEPGALQPVANFLFEVGMLRRTPRSVLDLYLVSLILLASKLKNWYKLSLIG